MDYLKCKHCSKHLSPDALLCSNCGNTDPLYNNERKEILEEGDKLAKKTKYFLFLLVLIIALIIVHFSLTTESDIVKIFPFLYLAFVPAVLLFAGLAISIFVLVNHFNKGKLLDKKFDEVRSKQYGLRVE